MCVTVVALAGEDEDIEVHMALAEVPGFPTLVGDLVEGCQHEADLRAAAGDERDGWRSIRVLNQWAYEKTIVAQQQRYAEWRLRSDQMLGALTPKTGIFKEGVDGEELKQLEVSEAGGENGGNFGQSLKEVLDDEPAKIGTQEAQESHELRSDGIVAFLEQVGEQEVSKIIQEQGGGLLVGGAPELGEEALRGRCGSSGRCLTGVAC